MKIYIKSFLNNNIDILYDERDASVGKKFSDSDLLGFPFQIIVGPQRFKEQYYRN